MKLRIQLLSLFFLSFLFANSQVTVDLSPSKDNTLYENATGALSNGSGEFLFAGRTNQSSNFLRRGLIHFDIACKIPSGATITSVQLIMEASQNNSDSRVISLHKMTKDWGESTSDAAGGEGAGAPSQNNDATWVHNFFNTSNWASGGANGDFNGSPTVSTSVSSSGSYTWGSNAQIVADVQDWLDNPNSNFGWLIRGVETSAGSAKKFNSRENDQDTPILRISYTCPSNQCSLDGCAGRDNTLYETTSGATSNGAGEFMFVGRNIQLSNNIRRGLIQFDIADLVPPGSTITRVVLNMYASAVDNTTFRAISLHPITSDWGEGDTDAPGNEEQGSSTGIGEVSWVHTFFNSDFWSTPGGDFNPTASGVALVGDIGFVTWDSNDAINSNMLTDVQNWFSDPSSNFGWLLQGLETTGSTIKRFNTSENKSLVSGNPTVPLLTIQYSTVVPVEFESFNVLKQHRNALLEWTTLQETQNEGFEIQRSQDGQQWESLDFVPGQGTTSKKSEYEYIDRKPIRGLNFYRLKQIDYDGSYAFSAIKSVRFLNVSDIRLFPNPVTDAVNIDLSDSFFEGSDIEIQIYDHTGHEVLKKAVTEVNDLITINLAQLPKSIYYLNINGQPINRFIKL